MTIERSFHPRKKCPFVIDHCHTHWTLFYLLQYLPPSSRLQILGCTAIYFFNGKVSIIHLVGDSFGWSNLFNYIALLIGIEQVRGKLACVHFLLNVQWSCSTLYNDFKLVIASQLSIQFHVILNRYAIADLLLLMLVHIVKIYPVFRRWKRCGW